MRRALWVALGAGVVGLWGWGCASVQTEQLERIEAYRADRAHEFAVRFANSKVDVRGADLQAIVTSEAINKPLEQFKQHVFKFDSGYVFTPTHAPTVELSTGSAILRITGNLQNGEQGRPVEVTVTSGLTVRWTSDGSHLYFKPTSLAVVPTLHVGVLDFALGSTIRSIAETEAAKYLKEQVGEIDVPINLMLPVQRPAIDLDQVLDVGPDEAGARLHYDFPAATAEVRLKQLFVWPVEGRLVVLAYADVAGAGEPAQLPPAPLTPEMPTQPAVDGGKP